MTPDPLISVIVVTWNGRQHLEACLTAVGAQEGVSMETILVDNASTDGTAAYVREQYPWVRLVTLPENRGFAGGNNAGVREARGRWLAFLNNDTIADSRWLSALTRAVADAPDVLATSRIVYMHDPEVLDSAGDGMLRWGGAFKHHHGGPVALARDSREVFGVCGAAFMMAKTVFEELEGFDERFFVSHEDVDLSYRARLRGYRCEYVADAIVRHVGSATLGRGSAFAVFHGQRNLEWVYIKNTPAPLLARTLLGHVLYDLAAAAYFVKVGLFGAFLRGKWAALVGIPRVIGQRARVQRSRVVESRAIWQQMDAGWLSTKLREKRFDTRTVGQR